MMEEFDVLLSLSRRVHIEKEEREYTWAWRKVMFVKTVTSWDGNVKINESTCIPKWMKIDLNTMCESFRLRNFNLFLVNR